MVWINDLGGKKGDFYFYCIAFCLLNHCVRSHTFADLRCNNGNDRLCQLSGMLHYIDVTETQKWSRHWNYSMLPQYVLTGCGDLWQSDHIEGDNGVSTRRWHVLWFSSQTLHGCCQRKVSSGWLPLYRRRNLRENVEVTISGVHFIDDYLF